MGLDIAGAKVACRDISLEPQEEAIPDRISFLEAQTLPNYDFCIQHVPVEAMDYNGTAGINVGVIHNTNFVRRTQILDSYTNFNSSIFGWPMDMAKYEKSYKPNRGNNNFVFYTIGGQDRTKNLALVLRAFYTEFQSYEPVSLVVQSENDVTVLAKEIKGRLKLNRYPHDQFIIGKLDEEQNAILHVSGDCYLGMSYYELWNIDAFDAMAFGKTPILSDIAGHNFLIDDVGWSIDCREEFSFGSGVLDCSEKWFSADIISLRKTMRNAYHNESLRKSKSAKGLSRAYDFSLQRVGNLFLKDLTDIYEQKEKRKLARH